MPIVRGGKYHAGNLSHGARLGRAAARGRGFGTGLCRNVPLLATVSDTQRGEVWSAGYQPSGVTADVYEAVFAEDRAEIHRRDGAISTTMEVVVSPEDDAEVRRISITNLGVRTREIEVTSYAEVVLAPPAADTAHPVFSNLFVQTEFVPDVSTLLATRRPRSPDEAPVWAAHVVVVEGETVGGAQYETDRARFLGRGRGIRTPMSVVDGRPLSNTTGAVLDPIFSLRHRVRLAAGASAHLTFSTLVSSSREAALDLADKYHDPKNKSSLQKQAIPRLLFRMTQDSSFFGHCDASSTAVSILPPSPIRRPGRLQRRSAGTREMSATSTQCWTGLSLIARFARPRGCARAVHAL